ncbi:MAG TPA: YbhN family protein, partial [Humisphaera sp.]
MTAPDPIPRAPTALTRAIVMSWALFLLKNVLGWALILASFVIGPALPGPGGIPVFIVGFAMVTFPGKRRLTARVLRGRQLDARLRAYRIFVVSAALVVPAVALVIIRVKWNPWARPHTSGLAAETFACYLAAAAVLAAALWNGRALNWFIRKVPRVRRKVRPWMRHRGIDLLPPRRSRRFVAAQYHERRRSPADVSSMEETILEIDPRHVTNAQRFWHRAKPWVKRVMAVVITAAIFAWILKPIVLNWDRVGARVMATNWGRVFGASVLFAVYLFTFRALVWRRLLKNFGHKLPAAVTTRIWITSELARYLPGSVWQVVGRVYLTKPYGVRGSVVSTSQVMELALYLLANLIVALGTMAFLGYRTVHGVTRTWLIVAMVLVPLLSLALHPKVFYPIADRILKRLKKPPIRKRMRWKSLIDLLLWNVLGLCVQGLAIYLVVFRLLGLPPEKWWVVTGAFCLSWCAGFLAFWAPGGLGVREAVFIAVMSLAMPIAKHTTGVAEDERLFLIFLSVLLRIWATVGELILSGFAYLFDMKGALGIDPPRHPKRGFEVISQPEG